MLQQKMKLKNLLKPSQFNNMHSFNFLNDKSLVLKRNKYLLTNSLIIILIIWFRPFQVGKHKVAMLDAFHAKNFTGNRTALVGVGIEHAKLLKYAEILTLQKGAGMSYFFFLFVQIIFVSTAK